MNLQPASFHFDMKLDNYSVEELEDIFQLRKRNYSRRLLETKTKRMIDNLKRDRGTPITTKNKSIEFLLAAKDILLLNCSNTDVFNQKNDLHISDRLNQGGENQFIIDRPRVPYVKSSPNEFYTGLINPLDKRVLIQNLNIDSRFRENYYASPASNYHVDLPLKMKKVVSMQVTSIELPPFPYNISKSLGNHFFWIYLTPITNDSPSLYNDEENIPHSLCVIIPDGYYTPEALIYFIQTCIAYSSNTDIQNIQIGINRNSNHNSTTTSSPVYGVTNPIDNSGTGQTFFGLLQESDKYNIELNFQNDLKGYPDTYTPLPLKLGWILGFRQGMYENSQNYISEGSINCCLSTYLFLVVDDYNNNVNNGFFSAFSSSTLNKNILARITRGPGTGWDAQNNLKLITTPRQYFGPVNIQKLGIQLLDEYGRIIPMNAMDFSFCITLQTLYDL